MRAVICDWCGAVSVDQAGWITVSEAPGRVATPLSGEPRTFCSVDCTGHFLDDARTAPTGAELGSAPYPAHVEPVPAPPPIHAVVTSPTAADVSEPLRGLGRRLGQSAS